MRHRHQGHKVPSMAVQKQRVVWIVGGTLVVFMLISIALWAIRIYSSQQYAALHQGCQPSNITHTVIIQNNLVRPSHTVARRCEKLTITNLDSTERLIAFGQHTNHVPYDGVEEILLKREQSLTITLIQTGDFLFHDHEHDDVRGTFTVQ